MTIKPPRQAAPDTPPMEGNSLILFPSCGGVPIQAGLFPSAGGVPRRGGVVLEGRGGVR
jgi:hypothetical protein